MRDALGDVALLQFGQVEAGGEMLALAVSTTAPMPSGSDVKNASMPMMVSSSSALRFCGAVELQDGDVALPLGGKRGGQIAQQRTLDDILLAHTCATRLGASCRPGSPLRATLSS